MPMYYYRAHCGPVNVQWYCDQLLAIASQDVSGIFPGTEYVYFRIESPDLDTARCLADAVCAEAKLVRPRYLKADHRIDLPLDPTCHAEHMRQWIADLRTTTAQQIRGYLCSHFNGIDGYCCLGRVGELLITEQPAVFGWRDADPSTRPSFYSKSFTPLLPSTATDLDGSRFNYTASESYQLSPEMRVWLGITEPDPVLYRLDAPLPDRDSDNMIGIRRGDHAVLTASFLNDAGMPFPMIADLLRQRFFPRPSPDA